MIPTLIVLLVAGVVLRAGLVMYRMGVEGGDRQTDATTRADLVAGQFVVVVANPSSVPITVGVTVMGPSLLYRVARWGGAHPEGRILARRPARWYERSRADRGAAQVLGVVPAGGEGRWSWPAPTGAGRLRIVLGQADNRLRIHEHLMHPAA